MGSDGPLGLRAIKEQGGFSLVQEPASAKFDSMPRSAIAAGLADAVANRIMPYRTRDKIIDGVVITCNDITTAQKTVDELRDEIERLKARCACNQGEPP